METIAKLADICTYYLSVGGPIVGFFLLMLESFIPMLPLNLFVALNVNAFGFIKGVIISWLGTCTGCFLCYLIFLKLSNRVIYKMLSDNMKAKIGKVIDRFKNISLSGLVLLITLPFIPSFLINITSGIVGLSKEKFLIAILIGKFFIVVFWGYIGKSIFESLTDIKSIVYIIITLILAYIISKIIGKKANID